MILKFFLLFFLFSTQNLFASLNVFHGLKNLGVILDLKSHEEILRKYTKYNQTRSNPISMMDFIEKLICHELSLLQGAPENGKILYDILQNRKAQSIDVDQNFLINVDGLTPDQIQLFFDKIFPLHKIAIENANFKLIQEINFSKLDLLKVAYFLGTPESKNKFQSIVKNFSNENLRYKSQPVFEKLFQIFTNAFHKNWNHIFKPEFSAEDLYSFCIQNGINPNELSGDAQHRISTLMKARFYHALYGVHLPNAQKLQEMNDVLQQMSDKDNLFKNNDRIKSIQNLTHEQLRNVFHEIFPHNDFENSIFNPIYLIAMKFNLGDEMEKIRIIAILKKQTQTSNHRTTNLSVAQSLPSPERKIQEKPQGVVGSNRKKYYLLILPAFVSAYILSLTSDEDSEQEETKAKEKK